MRYIVEKVILDKIHPNWPNTTMYVLKDTVTGRQCLGHYTTYDVAEEMMKKKNLHDAQKS